MANKSTPLFRERTYYVPVSYNPSHANQHVRMKVFKLSPLGMLLFFTAYHEDIKIMSYFSQAEISSALSIRNVQSEDIVKAMSEVKKAYSFVNGIINHGKSD